MTSRFFCSLLHRIFSSILRPFRVALCFGFLARDPSDVWATTLRDGLPHTHNHDESAKLKEYTNGATIDEKLLNYSVMFFAQCITSNLRTYNHDATTEAHKIMWHTVLLLKRNWKLMSCTSKNITFFWSLLQQIFLEPTLFRIALWLASSWSPWRFATTMTSLVFSSTPREEVSRRHFSLTWRVTAQLRWNFVAWLSPSTCLKTWQNLTTRRRNHCVLWDTQKSAMFNQRALENKCRRSHRDNKVCLANALLDNRPTTRTSDCPVLFFYIRRALAGAQQLDISKERSLENIQNVHSQRRKVSAKRTGNNTLYFWCWNFTIKCFWKRRNLLLEIIARFPRRNCGKFEIFIGKDTLEISRIPPPSHPPQLFPGKLHYSREN